MKSLAGIRRTVDTPDPDFPGGYSGGTDGQKIAVGFGVDRFTNTHPAPDDDEPDDLTDTDPDEDEDEDEEDEEEEGDEDEDEDGFDDGDTGLDDAGFPLDPR